MSPTVKNYKWLWKRHHKVDKRGSYDKWLDEKTYLSRFHYSLLCLPLLACSQFANFVCTARRIFAISPWFLLSFRLCNAHHGPHNYQQPGRCECFDCRHCLSVAVCAGQFLRWQLLQLSLLVHLHQPCWIRKQMPCCLRAWVSWRLASLLQLPRSKVDHLCLLLHFWTLFWCPLCC